MEDSAFVICKELASVARDHIELHDILQRQDREYVECDVEGKLGKHLEKVSVCRGGDKPVYLRVSIVPERELVESIVETRQDYNRRLQMMQVCDRAPRGAVRRPTDDFMYGSEKGEPPGLYLNPLRSPTWMIDVSGNGDEHFSWREESSARIYHCSKKL